MKEKLKLIIQGYLGMTPADKGCTNWNEMQNKMRSEIIQLIEAPKTYLLNGDIVKYIHCFVYRGFEVKITERKNHVLSNVPTFLYLYIIDSNGRENYCCQGIRDLELKDLNVAIPKIQEAIDKDIEKRAEWDNEAKERKQHLKWTGRKFKRGEPVYFKGNEKYKATQSFVWTYFGHMSLAFYIIEHPDGEDRSRWLAKPPFEHNDGFECVHSSQLQEGLKYIQINCSEEFYGETDELKLIE